MAISYKFRFMLLSIIPHQPRKINPSKQKAGDKVSYIPFTDEQKILANSVDLEEFLRMRGEKLERVGREHKLIYCDSSGRHDSITLRGSTWFDHKNQVGGGAIKFMQEFYGMDFQTAVQELLGLVLSISLDTIYSNKNYAARKI